ncbi:hypothetical protein Sjap_016704 [Stephania japonica]|uniref:Uncharacterized protein n=1 Tax=Stephania japonica TaxID=461633 RepID=A0AAP0NS30_9MAGN
MMRRHSCGVQEGGLIRGASNIRKRGCLSSSSSSSTTMRYKRALLIRNKRGRLSPIWKAKSKMSTNSSIKTTEPNGRKGRGIPVSGRKLAASLWKMNEIVSPLMRHGAESTGWKKGGRSIEDMMQRPFVLRPRTHLHKRTSAANCNFGSTSSWSRATSMEIADCSCGSSHIRSCTDDRTGWKKLRNITVSCLQLVKLLGHTWEHKHQYFSGVFVLSSLNSELNRARKQINHMIHEQQCNADRKRLQHKATWKSEEQERICTATIKSISGDLERERRLRKRSEKFSKTLLQELALTRDALSKATKEAKSEKRAREILEQARNELARGIGEDRAEVEELRRNSTRVQEEVEKEREMLHLADMMREERVQMKLSEAKYQFEEKNAVVDKLRNELQVFLKAKQNERGSQNHESKSKDDAYRSKVNKEDWYLDKGTRIDDREEFCRDVDPEEEYSSEGDLHSIELNVDDLVRLSFPN